MQRVTPVDDRPDIRVAEAAPLSGVAPLPLSLLKALPKFATRRFARNALGETGRYLRDVAKILAGTSSVTPQKRDIRFDDPTWSSNPIYNRLMQLYLRTADLARVLPDQADIDWTTAERLQFIISILVDAASPTNTLLGNPVALRRAVETRGRSLIQATRNLRDDMQAGRILPSRADARAFRVGENIANTPGAVVHRTEMFELLQYAPSTQTQRSRPLVFVPSYGNRSYAADLTPKRSLVRAAVHQGLMTFCMVWRNPGPSQGHWGFDDYVASCLEAADVVSDISGGDALNLVSVCGSGTVTAAMLAHMAQMGDRRVASASMFLTFIDGLITSPDDLFSWRGMVGLTRYLERNGIVSGRDVGALLRWRRPNSMIWPFWIRHYLYGEPPAVDELAFWADEDQNLAGTMLRETVDIYRTSALLKPNGMEVLGTPIDLSKVDCDTYFVAAGYDQSCPWKAAYRPVEVLGGDSEFVLSPTGHMQTLFRGRRNLNAEFLANGEVGSGPEHWRDTASMQKGSWWMHWRRWLEERAGEPVPARTKLGNLRHPPLDPGPGRYATEVPR